MAESISHQYRGKVTRVYLGEGKPEPPKSSEVKKADTIYNKHMQELFDIVAPEALEEHVSAAEAQGELATETAAELAEKSTAYHRYKEHKNLKRFVSELDTEWRGRELPHKLERMLLFSVIGGISWGIDFGADLLASKTFLNKNRREFARVIKFQEHDANGNRKALKVGWEVLTDKLIGSFSDKSVQESTNRKDAGFVSPLSDSMAKLGNVVSAIVTPEDQKFVHRFVNALVNPSTIEAGFRGLSSIPVIGAKLENVYIALNKQLLKGEGSLPFGFDMAVAMLAAKETQSKHIEMIHEASGGKS